MKEHLNWAWGRLLVVLTISWVLTYLIFLGLLSVSAVTVDGVFGVATGGVRHVSLPIVEAGVARGVPMGLMFFAINFSVSIVFVLLLVASPLLDPNAKQEFPSLVRRMLTKTTAPDRVLYRLLGFLPSFKQLGDDDLRPLTVWLNVTPPLAMAVLGIELGAVTAAMQLKFDSLLFSALLLLPHCVLELPAVCLAGSLPFGAYRSVRDAARAGNVSGVFGKLRDITRSRQLLIRLAAIPCILLVAGVVESRLTLLLASWATGQS